MGIKQITIEHLGELERFLSVAGKSLERFRYFASRPISIITQHRLTLLYFNRNNEPVGYGHLDEENGTIWLGTCVAASETGKGIGSKIMQALLNYARNHRLPRIRLSVDNINTAAQHLYETFGFICVEKKESIRFYDWVAEKSPELLVSTLAFLGRSAEDVVSEAKQNRWSVEFSSGMPFREDMTDIFLSAPLIRYAHNYFPAPQEPFVLNLASASEQIRNRSIEHCVQGMQMSEKAGGRFFSAHAGFCVDPSPDELGNPIAKRKFTDRDTHFTYFLNSIREILQRTRDLQISFLIENNVIAEMNLYDDKTNPLLCCDAAEIRKLMACIPDARLGILLDTAHLKVSAATLGLNLIEEVERIKEFIWGIHHSDNNGLRDTNEFVADDYWFYPFLKSFPFATHVLEVKKLTAPQVNQQLDFLRNGISAVSK